MPALNYSEQFAGKVESGEKRQTIRKIRKNPIKKGDTLFQYTGMRTKKCRKLREDVCTHAIPLFIGRTIMKLNGHVLAQHEERRLAQDDGFDSLIDFVAWFDCRYGTPFNGVVIRW